MHYQAQSNDGERYRPVDYEEGFLYSVTKIPDPDDQQKYHIKGLFDQDAIHVINKPLNPLDHATRIPAGTKYRSHRSLSTQVTVYCQEFLCVTSSISIVFLNQFNLLSLQFTCEYVLKYSTILSSIERMSVSNLATRAPDSPGFTAVLINCELLKHKGTKFALGTRLVGTSPRFLAKSPCRRFSWEILVPK